MKDRRISKLLLLKKRLLAEFQFETNSTKRVKIQSLVASIDNIVDSLVKRVIISPLVLDRLLNMLEKM